MAHPVYPRQISLSLHAASCLYKQGALGKLRYTNLKLHFLPPVYCPQKQTKGMIKIKKITISHTNLNITIGLGTHLFICTDT